MTFLTLDAVQVIRAGTPLHSPITAVVTPGTVLGLVGPNGVGKSSLLGAIAHTGISCTGQVRYGATDLAAIKASQRAQILSLLTQDTGAPGELTARDVVTVGARAGGRGGSADGALESLGISGLANRRMGTLSGGQRQLVQLARVLAQDTPVVLLDEPTSALDLAYAQVIERTTRRLAQQGRIVIAAIHDLNLALSTCTQVLALDAGGGHHLGTPGQILQPDLIHRIYGVRTDLIQATSGRSVVVTSESL